MDNTLRKMKRNQGLTLIETLIAVAVGVVALIGALVLYPSIQKNQQEENVLTALNSLDVNITKAFSTQGNYNGLSDQTAIQMGLVPDDLTVNTSNNTITDPWGGAVTLAPNSSNPQQFTITFANIPLSQCLNIVSQFIPDNLVAISGAGSVQITNVSQARQNAVANAQTVCGSTDPVPQVTWTLQ